MLIETENLDSRDWPVFCNLIGQPTYIFGVGVSLSNLHSVLAMAQKCVLLETSIGPITFELYWDHAPKTCENFYTLAQNGFYNGVLFHRIIKVRIKISISLTPTLEIAVSASLLAHKLTDFVSGFHHPRWRPHGHWHWRSIDLRKALRR